MMDFARNSFKLNDTAWDCVFLSLVFLVSIGLYVFRLGFYSDDWSFLGYLSLSNDQSLGGLFRSIYSPWVEMRPIQVLYWAGLYWLFDTDPLGYHLVNALVMLAGIFLFYLALRELGQSRSIALALPLVYALLPHYSTTRFWAAAFQINLSMTLYFLSIYSDLRSLRASISQLWFWKFTSVLSLLGSILAYEVTLPLFLLNPLLVWYRGRQLCQGKVKRRSFHWNLSALIVINLLVLTTISVYKAQTTQRMGLVEESMINRVSTITRGAFSLRTNQYDYGLNYVRALGVSYGEYGIRLPVILWRIFRDYPNGAAFVMAGLLGLVVFIYLLRVARQSETGLPTWIQSLRLVLFGVVVFFMGYAIFLTNYNVLISATGIGNRTAVAAALGVAVSLVGGIALVSNWLPCEHLRQGFFSLSVTLLCVCGYLINNTIASFWVTAYRQEQQILQDIYQHFPELSPGSTLILDGVCPYAGPAIIFESSWDLAGALMLHYSDYSIKADVVAPNMQIGEDGLTTSLYGEEHNYPYGNLFIYHFGRQIGYELNDAGTARSYFEHFNVDYNQDCPFGRAGFGVPIY